MHDEQHLFSRLALHTAMEAKKAEMIREIGIYPANEILNTSADDLAAYFATKFEIAPVRILDEHIKADHQETQIDVSQDQSRFIVRRDRPIYVPGTRVTLYVPFEGDANVFMCTPSTFTNYFPRGRIQGNVLELMVTLADHNMEATKRALDELLGSVRQYLGWAAKDLAAFNASLSGEARAKISARRERLLGDQRLVASLGFPLRERPDALTTYITPELRRKATPKPPPASTAAFAPEPTIEMAEYEKILLVIQQTATMLERSPQAFRNMEEENLRDQFLVPLNSHYEGQATGETFNSAGKTDILIRDGDRCVFIAECKIWRGQKSLSDAIDQLLGYATWRDTKTAILIFNRNKNLGEVLDKIPGILRSHSNSKRELPYQSETGFRYVLAHKDDPNREITLTVLVFDVPS